MSERTTPDTSEHLWRIGKVVDAHTWLHVEVYCARCEQTGAVRMTAAEVASSPLLNEGCDVVAVSHEGRSDDEG